MKYTLISDFSVACLVFDSNYEQGDVNQLGPNTSLEDKNEEVRLEINFALTLL